MDAFLSQTYWYKMIPSILHKSSKTLLKNIIFVMAGLICTLVENNCQKQIFGRATEGFKKPQLSWWNWLNWIRKELKNPQTELSQPKTIENNKNLTFIRTSNPNNPAIFELLRLGVNALVEKNVNGFKYIELIHAKQQPPNLKRILIKYFIYK